MIGYKHPCRYCDEFIPPNSNTCPLCGKVNPLDSLRCPRCRDIVRKAWENCPNCGLLLETSCPYCSETTFFGDYCDECESRLIMVCSDEECELQQPPIGSECAACGKPLETIQDGG